MTDKSYPTIELTPDTHKYLMRHCPPAVLQVASELNQYTKTKMLNRGQGIVPTQAETSRMFAKETTLFSTRVMFLAINLIAHGLNEPEEVLKKRLLELTTLINNQKITEYHIGLRCDVKYGRKRIELSSLLITAPITSLEDDNKRQLSLGKYDCEKPVDAAFFRAAIEKFLCLKDSHVASVETKWKYKGKEHTELEADDAGVKRTLTSSEFIEDVVKKATVSTDRVAFTMEKKRFFLTINRRTHMWKAVESRPHLTAVK